MRTPYSSSLSSMEIESCIRHQLRDFGPFLFRSREGCVPQLSNLGFCLVALFEVHDPWLGTALHSADLHSREPGSGSGESCSID